MGVFIVFMHNELKKIVDYFSVKITKERWSSNFTFQAY